jgi:predicted transcriptional regulator
MAKTTVFSVRVSLELKAKLESVAAAMDRPRSWVVNDALEQYVADQAWQIEAIKEGIAAADRGEVVAHQDVVAKWERKLADRLEQTGGT